VEARRWDFEFRARVNPMAVRLRLGIGWGPQVRSIYGQGAVRSCQRIKGQAGFEFTMCIGGESGISGDRTLLIS